MRRSIAPCLHLLVASQLPPTEQVLPLFTIQEVGVSVQPDHTDTVSACWYTRQTPELCGLHRRPLLSEQTRLALGGWLQAPQHLHQDDTEDVVLFCTCRGSPQ